MHWGRPPGAFPAVSAVVVQGDTTLLMHVRGVSRAGEAASVDRHTRFYIASQTKSFIALLAAQLDGKGVLPLDCDGYSLGWYTCTYKQHRVANDSPELRLIHREPLPWFGRSRPRSVRFRPKADTRALSGYSPDRTYGAAH